MADLELNTLMSDRARLLIMATLAASRGGMDFTSLLNALELSRGNLSSHMRKLEEGGLVSVKKEFLERKPCTTYRCTPKGRAEVKRYLEAVESMLRGIKG